MKKTMTVMLVCVLLGWAGSSMAEDAAKTVTVEVTGKNVNLVKTLCGEEAPETDAALGGLNVLLVKEARDAEGNAIEGMAGKMLHYLPVAAASKLIAGEENAGKMVTVKGALYKEALVISVSEFEVKAAEAAADGGGDFDEWDELGVTTMSQQQVI